MASRLALAAAGAGLLFVGYCIYFDRKRRSHPEFRKKLVQKRQDRRVQQPDDKKKDLPRLDDREAMQEFFLHEIQLGEAMLFQGEIEEGIEHFANAVAVCSQPQQLLSVLRQSLPPQVFAMLETKIPSVTRELQKSLSSGGLSSAGLASDDDLNLD